MPVKIARSTPRPSFGLPEPLVGIHTSRQSCCKAAKARIFTPVRESSGESRKKRDRRGDTQARDRWFHKDDPFIAELSLFAKKVNGR